MKSRPSPISPRRGISAHHVLTRSVHEDGLYVPLRVSMTSRKRLQQELRRNSFTGVIVSERGAVVKVIPFDTPPPYEVLVECLRPHRPCGFSLYVKGEYSIE